MDTANNNKKWYDNTLIKRVIVPLVITAIAIYMLVLLKHFGFID
ncbi:MAG: hypothetical protein JWO06_3985 [Bacteroidota bacterium]|nr:hypothetical protein [Bacteroidota bacterium]